ncbi:MAG: HAD hydrolase-like protein [Rubrivivax sp.]
MPYNVDPALVRFTANAFGLRALDEAGWPLVMVTNQSGLASGRFGLAQYEHLAAHHRAAPARGSRHRAGRLVHLPACGDAAAGMPLPQAGPWLAARGRRTARHRPRPIVDGDTLDDVEAGRRAGCNAVLVETGGETEWQPRHRGKEPHHRCADLLAARA